ncbi:MAG: alkaline phosphatase family protein, partial [Geminicoccaceae bacterium]
MRRILYPSLTAAACAAVVSVAQAQPASRDATLIVQITVDGLRGDLLSRYQDSFGPDGFRRFMDNGLWYLDAHHGHANTETIVGHATLSTGAHPSEHGMVGNVWFDRSDGRLVYNIEDVAHPIIPTTSTPTTLEQVDPAQAIAAAGGRSPANLLVTTFSDELTKARAGEAKVIAISGKDRSAVAMAGHFGDAYWMSTATGHFETSRYYQNAYPDWVRDWNTANPADAGIGGAWTLHDPLETYLLADQDDRPYEADLRGFGRSFPHTYGDPEDGLYYTQVLLSPLGDQLTADFAKAAVRAEGLGAGPATDYLSVSFSGVDATNHFFGPSSLESEEMVRALDRTLADLFAFLDDAVGADMVLYVLSADHGMPEIAEYMAEQ